MNGQNQSKKIMYILVVVEVFIVCTVSSAVSSAVLSCCLACTQLYIAVLLPALTVSH